VFAGRIKRNQFLLSFFVVAYSLSIIAFFVTGRFRIPLVPILIIWGAVGAWTLINHYKRGDYRKFYRYLIIFLVALLLFNGLTHLSTFSVRPPNEYESHLFLGDAYLAAGEFEKAEDELLTAARLYPRSARVFNSLGRSLAAQYKDSLAVEAYRRGIAVNPDYEVIRKNLAYLYKQRNKVKELYDFVQAEMARDPDASWAIKEWAYIHTLLDRPDKAVEIYEQAFQADSTDLDALFQKAQIYLEMEDAEAAEKEYQRLLEYVPNSVEVHANLGQAYARQGRLQEALREFLWVQQREPEDPSAYFNLASVYIQMNRLNEAEQMIARITQLQPDFPVRGLRELLERKRNPSEPIQEDMLGPTGEQ
jgi:tetratricopeptide (TPR) repeat protein